MEKQNIPKYLHEQYADLKRILKVINAKRVRIPDSMTQVQFEANDITGFLKAYMWQLVSKRQHPICFEEYQPYEYRYTAIISGVAYWLIVEEAAIEKSKFDAEGFKAESEAIAQMEKEAGGAI